MSTSRTVITAALVVASGAAIAGMVNYTRRVETAMKTAKVDGGRNLGQRGGRQRKRPFEAQRLRCRFRRQQRQRNFRDIAFLAAQAGPERRADEGLDGLDLREGREDLDGSRDVAVAVAQIACEMVLEALRHLPPRRIHAVRHNQ